MYEYGEIRWARRSRFSGGYHSTGVGWRSCLKQVMKTIQLYFHCMFDNTDSLKYHFGFVIEQDLRANQFNLFTVSHDAPF
jgi:hypothetical protein